MRAWSGTASGARRGGEDGRAEGLLGPAGQGAHGKDGLCKTELRAAL